MRGPRKFSRGLGGAVRLQLGWAGLPQFFVKKPKIFENVKSERAAANDAARVNHNFQKFSDLRHKQHVCWINHYNEHDTTLFLSDFNESGVN